MISIATTMLLAVFTIFAALASAASVPSTCKQPGHIALTFDQGPGVGTGRVLDVLSRRNIPATFHVSADLLRNATLRAYIKRAALEGHTIGMFMPDLGGTIQDSELQSNETDLQLYQNVVKSSNWISSLIGRQPVYIRFGRKSIPQATKRLIDSMGLVATRAKIEIRDESNKLDSIWGSIQKGFNGTLPAEHSFVVKMRDMMPNMGASLDRMIDYIESKGFTIVPMEKCAPMPEKLIAMLASRSKKEPKNQSLGTNSTSSASQSRPSQILALTLFLFALWQ
jgi:peptidoglycan/xylan/chitin deacetylase (PgdA/CDA1 family)